MTTNKISPEQLGLNEQFPLPCRENWRIGMVGFGSIARNAHLPAYKSVGLQVAGVADTSSEARQAATELGIEHIVADFRELVKNDAIDVIDLCTQPTVREEVVVAAAKAGKPIITEKPLAVTLDECVRMVGLCEKAGIKFAVHQNYRWMKANYLALQIIKSGLIGRPFYASIHIFGNQDIGLAGHPYYSKVDNFITIQWENHLVDLLRYWTVQDPRRIFCKTGRMKGQNLTGDALLVSVLDFGEGLTGQIIHHELLRSSLGGVQCRIDGDKGSLVFDFQDKIQIESATIGEGPHLLNMSQGKWCDSFAGSMADFLIAIENDTEPMVSARRNLATMRAIIAEDASARAGGEWVCCGSQAGLTR